MCPQNILLNEKGQTRFVNRYSWPGQPEYFIPQTLSENYYLSP